MGKSSGSRPEAPDPVKVAAAQGAEDRKTFQYQLENARVKTRNPYGTTGWTNAKTFDQAGFDKALADYKASYRPPSESGYELRSGRNSDREVFTPGDGGGYALPAPDRAAFEGKDDWTFSQELSPESQGIFDSATGHMKTGLSGLNLDPNSYNASVADAIQRRMLRMAQPGLEEQRNAVRTRLADSGFQVGNEGYNTEMDRLDTNQGQTFADIADRAQITGAQQGLSDRASLIAAIQAMQGIRGGEMAGLSGATPSAQTPGIQAPDIAGMTMSKYNSDLDAYNADQASNNAMIGNLVNMGALIAAPYTGGASLSAGGLFKGMQPGGANPPSLPSMGGGTGVRMNGFYARS